MANNSRIARIGNPVIHILEILLIAVGMFSGVEAGTPTDCLAA